MTSVFRAIAILALVTMASGCTSIGEREQKCSVPVDAPAMLEELVTLVNDARESAGLDPVVLDDVLSAAAAEHACQMIEEDFFAHDDPYRGLSAAKRLSEADYLYHGMGENLAAAQPTAEDVFDDWMASELHRENILNPAWQEMGLAVRHGGRYQWYWVQEFAHPLDFDAP